MEFYFESKCKKDCFNCGVCELSCPVKAIKIARNVLTVENVKRFVLI